jgi:hypothetical protein
VGGAKRLRPPAEDADATGGVKTPEHMTRSATTETTTAEGLMVFIVQFTILLFA